MATQSILAGPLGEDSLGALPSTTHRADVQTYLQNLMGNTDPTSRILQLVAESESLAKTSSQKDEVEVFAFLIDSSVMNLLVQRSRPVLEAIDALQAGIEDEVIPTEYAYERARSIVESAYGRAKEHENVPKIAPKPSVTTDDVGGIRLSWRDGDKTVRANFGARPEPELRSYLYFESSTEHDVEPLDAQHLAGRLAWLTER